MNLDFVDIFVTCFDTSFRILFVELLRNCDDLFLAGKLECQIVVWIDFQVLG
jgi:hypothetical protein